MCASRMPIPTSSMVLKQSIFARQVVIPAKEGIYYLLITC